MTVWLDVTPISGDAPMVLNLAHVEAARPLTIDAGPAGTTPGWVLFVGGQPVGWVSDLAWTRIRAGQRP